MEIDPLRFKLYNNKKGFGETKVSQFTRSWLPDASETKIHPRVIVFFFFSPREKHQTKYLYLTWLDELLVMNLPQTTYSHPWNLISSS